MVVTLILSLLQIVDCSVVRCYHVEGLITTDRKSPWWLWLECVCGGMRYLCTLVATPAHHGPCSQCQDRPGANINHPLTGLNDIDKQAFMEIKTTTFFFVTK